MTSRRAIQIAAALAAIMLSASASAQPHRDRGGPGQPPGQPQGGPVACVPSGFARLTRNCSQNTGNCQRMPESCNRGWCCP